MVYPHQRWCVPTPRVYTAVNNVIVLLLLTCVLISRIEIKQYFGTQRSKLRSGLSGNGIQKTGSFSNDDGDGREKVPIKIYWRFFLLA